MAVHVSSECNRISHPLRFCRLFIYEFMTLRRSTWASNGMTWQKKRMNSMSNNIIIYFYHHRRRYHSPPSFVLFSCDRVTLLDSFAALSHCTSSVASNVYGQNHCNTHACWQRHHDLLSLRSSEQLWKIVTKSRKNRWECLRTKTNRNILRRAALILLLHLCFLYFRWKHSPFGFNIIFSASTLEFFSFGVRSEATKKRKTNNANIQGDVHRANDFMTLMCQSP